MYEQPMAEYPIKPVPSLSAWAMQELMRGVVEGKTHHKLLNVVDVHSLDESGLEGTGLVIYTKNGREYKITIEAV